MGRSKKPRAPNKAPSNRIREVRLLKGLTLEQLAEKVGVEHQTVQRWETGERSPSDKKLAVVAKALDVRPGDLMRDADAATAKPEPDPAALTEFLANNPFGRTADTDEIEWLRQYHRRLPGGRSPTVNMYYWALKSIREGNQANGA